MERSSRLVCLLTFLLVIVTLINLNLLQGVQRIADCQSPVQSNNQVPLSNVSQAERLSRNTLDDSPNHRQVDTEFLTKNSLQCPLSRRPSGDDLKIIQSVWQLHSYPSGDIYIYTAYYDDRPAAGFLPTVRLIVLMAVDNQPRNIYCHLWYDFATEPYISVASINETGMNRYRFDPVSDHVFYYKEYTYTCPLAIAYPIPTHVSITTQSLCENYKTFAAVSYFAKRQPHFEFGVCMANGYGAQPAEEFVEWMELLRFYGVSEVNLYDTSFVNMSALFRYYEEKGVLRVHKLPHPLIRAEELWERKVRNLRSVALNDCMLRNMYRYRYVVVLDFDEMIVPRQHVNYSTLIAQINARLNLSQTYHSYSFVNVFFLKDFPEDGKQTLRTMRYRFRTHQNVPYYASKSFVSPLSCFNLMNHYCYRPLPGYAGGEISMFAPIAVGASHHYRACGKFNALPCDKLMKEKTADDIMLRVRDRLLERMNTAYRELGRVL